MRWFRGLIIGVLVAASVNFAPSTRLMEPLSADVRMVGADFSFTLQEEATNNHVSENGETRPVEQILAGNGVNYSRLRLWVNPESGKNDLSSALAMGKRSNAAGMKLLLNLHYSDTWADHNDQDLPAAWRGLDMEGLTLQVRRYTREVLQAFARQGTPVSIVQLGNEVTNGMLWPFGQIYSSGEEHWEGFAELVKAGAAGARESNPENPPLIMLHTHGGGDLKVTRHFFDNAREHNMPFDLIGVTFYPFWGGSLGRLGRNLAYMAERYDKDIIVVETGYPWTLETSEDGPNVVRNASMLPQSAVYPPTPEGQADYYRGLRRVLANVPSGHGAGFFVWEPGWLPGVDAASNGGNGYSNLTLFDWEGRGLPGLKALNPVR
ncbi:glycosyl hydrolase 53 family protein [Arthrobacter sp. ISL-72]|uniref:glycoside hydrolase family 53 protein n=1 Tax=Arthrobacter sp. ISL-72 TaxID=2819114 RepID=UPI001BEB811A|nr:glycosyl hydrolase 53 family protein [Arthrobacter sp. ISL-72]MBT2594850.1 glycosyl hydrolase 53 family protein [Arthrobacter sp. ISL-72]